MLTRAFVLAGALCGAHACYATVIHDSFAPGHGYQPSSGWSVQQNGSSRTDHAMRFTPATGGVVDTIDVAVTHISGQNRVTLDLLTSVNGLPAVSLASWTLSNAMAEYGTNNAPVTFSNTNPALALTAGQTYWLMASTPNGTQAAWNLNSINLTEVLAQRQNGGSWSLFNGQSGAFDMDVSTVPTPAVLSLFGAAGLLAARRRR